jgi:DNA-binding transcriptional MerR regulator
MYTPSQVADKANVSVGSVRNWSNDYAELLSSGASGKAGPRLYTDEDMQVLCTVAALRRTGMLPAAIIARLKADAAPPVVDVAPSPPTETLQTSYNTPQTPQDALQANFLLPVVLSSHETRIAALEAHTRGAAWWNRLEGAAMALAVGGFVLWLLWLAAN